MDDNLCMESDMCNFQVLFCEYTTFIKETPGHYWLGNFVQIENEREKV